jgi:transposase
MMGKPQNLAPKLFYHTFCIEQRIPQDHPLRRIKALIDFDFVRGRVAGLYGSRGNVSVDPAVLLKLMFLLYYENVKSVRRLLSQLPLRLDWLWFCGYDIDDPTPDHSVIAKARRRWGKAIFAEFFQTILEQCIGAGLVDGQTIHIDSSMIDANASMDSLRPQLRQVGQTLYDQLEQEEQPADSSPATPEDSSHPSDDEVGKQISTTDPDARLGSKYDQTTLGYKDHRVVDDHCGIITATITTPAHVNDGTRLQQTVEKHETNTRTSVGTVVADTIYGTMDNYQYLHDRGARACIPHQRHAGGKTALFSCDQFTYDPQRDCLICPAGQPLTRYDRQRPYQWGGIRYRADRRTCQQCRFFTACVSSSVNGRQVVRNERAPYVKWADECLRPSQRKRLLSRRRCKAEGSFADAANNHGFKRARFRGLEQVEIQNLMIAAIQNLRKLLGVLGRNAVTLASGWIENSFFALFRLFRPLCYSMRRNPTVHRPF